MTTSIFSQVLGPVDSMLSEILQDSNFSEEVTYKKYVSQSFSEAVGHVVETYESTTLKAVRMKHTAESATVSTSNVQVGDVLFMFKGGVLPSGASLKDLIEDAEGNVLGIKGIDPWFNMVAVVTVQAGA